MKIPLGMCQCGCGGKTAVADGQTNRFIDGHSKRMPTTWLEENRGFATPCLIWQGGQSSGYAWWGSRKMSAYRVRWIDEHGPIESGYTLHHLCGQKMCVRVDHLELLTKSEHRKRHPYNTRRKHKLTEEQAAEIAASKDSLGVLARKYGISKPYASKLRRHKGRATGQVITPRHQGHPGRYRRGPITDGDYLVQDRGFTSLCWIWKGRNPDNPDYGKIRTWDGKHGLAHVAAYQQIFGPVPDGLVLDHLCGVRRCINPAHLEVISSAENIRRSKAAKLNWDIVREIRASDEPHTVLAKRYGVHPESIRFVRIGRTWRE